MSESIHALRTLLCTDAAERLNRFVSYADAHPKNNLGQYFAAREAWLQRDLALAHSYATRALAKELDAFEMLAICAEYHAERGDVAEAVRYAKQLLMSQKPNRFARRVSVGLCLIAPWRWRKLAKLNDEDGAIYDQWQRWATEYVKSQETAVGVA
jgi:hypothetical protein